MLVAIVLVLAVILAGLTGCSFVDSSKSISNSISSPSDWSKSSSASSSGGDDDEEAVAPEAPQDATSYETDVIQLAATFARSGGDIGALRSAVSTLATKRGITNWEVDSTTVQAIGQGVGQAGMDEASFTQFSKELFGEDLLKQTDLRTGYDKATAPEM